MQLIEHIQRVLHTSSEPTPLFTCEIVPPLKGHSLREFWQEIAHIADLRPAVMDVTYHHQDVVAHSVSSHTTEVSSPTSGFRLERKRAGTIGICGSILRKFGIDPAPHLICTGCDYSMLEDLLLDIYMLGMENLLVLQGDKRNCDPVFKAVPDGPMYALDLLKQVTLLQHGKYRNPEWALPDPPRFCIGVAGYPETHPAATSPEDDLAHLVSKVQAGANYIVTQMFFDNQKYFDFVQRCRKAGITVPILPGLKPITTKKQFASLPKIFHLSIPEELSKELRMAKNDEAVRQIGIEWCIAQCQELKKFGVPALHFYTMSKAHPTSDIVARVF